MNKKDYRRAIACFEPDPRLRERVEEAVKGRRPQMRMRPLRAGLMAAAMCAALVGTAFAATVVYGLMVKVYDGGTYHVVEKDGELRDEEFMRFEIHGEADGFALEEFSQQLQDDYHAWLMGQESSFPNRLFGDWESAKAYIGDSVPCTWRDTSGTVSEKKYGVQAVPDVSGETTNLNHVAFDSCFELPGGQAVEVVIYMHGEERPYKHLYGMAAPAGSSVQTLESYPMANGCTAQVVAQVSPPDPEALWAPSYCIGFFVNEGILYEVSLFGGNLGEIPMSQMESRLHQVLDTFY